MNDNANRSFRSSIRFTNIHVPCIDSEEETERSFTRADKGAYRGYLKFAESERKARALGKEVTSSGKADYTAWS